MFQRVCIMGVGLLGGSIGMALRARKLAREVVGHGRSSERLQKAIELGAIDLGYCDIADAARHADLIVACGPVQEIAKQLASASPFMLPTGVMTDVGSTKETILDEVHRLGISQSFVGSHPMAGSDRTGVEHASADLFEGRVVIVTTDSPVDPNRLNRIESFWRSLGARVILMGPHEHDVAVASISHLPHLLAAALAEFTPEQWIDVAASGWASTTRVAAGDPELWRQIFEENRDCLVDTFRAFEERLKVWKNAIELGDTQQLLHLLSAAQTKRLNATHQHTRGSDVSRTPG